MIWSRNEPSGASSVKNGPKTELSVAFPIGGLLSESTRADRPSTSERRINSWRSGVHVWPVRVRKLIVFIHSSVVMLRAINHESNGTDAQFYFRASLLRTTRKTHFVSETNSWSLLMRFLKMNLTRLSSRERFNVRIQTERDIEQMYARVWCELSKLEQIVRDNLWLVRVLRGERKKRTLTRKRKQCPTGSSRSGLGMPLGTAARTAVEDIVVGLEAVVGLDLGYTELIYSGGEGEPGGPRIILSRRSDGRIKEEQQGW